MKKIFTFYVNHFYTTLRSTILQNENTGKQENTELFSAPERCVDNIMSFARAYDSVESESVGTVEVIMN
ncbi:MAG: hypothetical protein PF486_06475 [Prolixibacteraceae bacterium]|jgi:hypothetical protein|nr:hypothetical protein [Prolixibacteraceae bacterium]